MITYICIIGVIFGLLQFRYASKNIEKEKRNLKKIFNIMGFVIIILSCLLFTIQKR